MSRKKIDTFEIEHKAIGVFSNLFTSSIKIEQKPDMEHIDYRLTFRENNEPTGKMFAVQLKGQEKVSISNGILKYPNFKVKHLKYYLEKLSYPVFIFVVDLANSKCYWQFTQKWLKDKIKNKNWVNQTTTTIYIPIQNKVTNEKDFSQIVNSAIEYMKRMHPISLRSAHQNELEKLKKIDPRFNIDTFITKNKIQHIMKPNLNVVFKLSMKDASSKKKYSDFKKTGHQVQFSSKEVDFPNFPIYQHLKRKSANLNVIISKRKLKSELHFQYKYQNKDYILIIPGSSFAGSEQITFQGSLIDNLFTISFNLILSNNSFSISNIQTYFEISSYVNKTILNLPYFDELFALINCMSDNLNIKVRLLTNGLEIFKAKFTESKRKLKIQEVTNLLFKSIEISKFFNVNPVLTSYNELFNNSKEICMIFDLIKYGKFVINHTGNFIYLSLRLNDTANKSEVMIPNESYDFMLVSEETIKPFLGYNVNIGKLIYIYANWLLVTDIKTHDTSSPSKLKLKANENSKIILYKIT